MANKTKNTPSWDDFYARERQNFSENPTDTGECWFSDSNAQSVMIQFLSDLAAEQPHILDETESTTFLDLGTGNGQLLMGIKDADFEGKLTGIDYSEDAVVFAAKVVEAEYYSGKREEDDEDEDEDEDEEKEEEENQFEFLHADFLTSNTWNVHNRKWRVVLDKGTLDAIALADVKYDTAQTGVQETGVQVYPRRVAELMAPDGVLLITSCNFTEEELVKVIEREGELVVFDRVEYPTFRFGGVKGQTVCTVAFRFKNCAT